MGDALQEADPVRSDLDLVHLRVENQASRMDLRRTTGKIKKDQLLLVEQELCF